MPKSVGAAPGTLTFDPEFRRPQIRVIAYGNDELLDTEASVEQLGGYLDSWPIVWVNVDGLGDEGTLRAIGEIFSLHRLALEDIVNLGQRAKVEPYEEDLFVVLRIPTDSHGHTEQVSMLVGRNYVLTLQEHPGDCFEPVRERIRHGKGRIRKAGADYLAYALVDAAIDSYFPVVEEFASRLEGLEDEVLQSSERSTVPKVHAVKRELNELRRTIWPHREALNSLLRETGPFISAETQIYLRDCYDHTIRVAELLESQRELCSDLMATYLSAVSNRMNEVMKVLAIIGTLFIPLGFIAGVYGMNFDPDASPWNMPELGWYLGYPFALSLMAAIVIGLLAFFWRKGWFK